MKQAVFSILALVWLLPASVLAASTTTCNGNECTVTDPNSDFSVSYNSNEAGLFGVVGLSNNTIFFRPDAFSAQSANGNGAELVTDTINLRLTATTLNFSFDSFFLNETGDYFLSGSGTEVTGYGEMRIAELADANTLFMDSFFIAGSGNQGQNNWFGDATVDSSVGWKGTTGEVLLTLQNILTANTASSGELAFIQKKTIGVEISVNPNPIPVPAAAWLMGSALVGLFGLRRRQA